MLSEITPLILTYNEAPNIGRTLERLRWASQILIVDSFSDDGTIEIAARHPQVRVVQRKFDSFAGQCNFGLDQVTSGWVLSLDADYVLGAGFEEEIAGLKLEKPVTGYRAAFRYCIDGRPLRACLYPARTVLYQRECARYEDDGHGHHVIVEGTVQDLTSRIDHDDRKPLSRWLASQDKYAKQEADKLCRTGGRGLKFQDRLRHWVVPAPVMVFFYCLLARGLILDGWRGWFYVWQRVLAEIMLSLRLLERRFSRSDG